MSQIEKFKNLVPKFADEEDGYESLCEFLNEHEVKQMIRDHFDDSEVIDSDVSGNPELETWRTVDGRTYLKYRYNTLFGIDYKKAYNDI